MAAQDTRPPKNYQKFLFDRHDFGDRKDAEEEDVDLAPPPPVFSEGELEAAKSAAYERGQRDALAQAQASREKFVADLLNTVGAQFSVLFEQEEARERRYEEEAILLSRAIFEKLFPAVSESGGLDEIHRTIAAVLETRKDQIEIAIEVNPEYVEDIRGLIDEALKNSQGIGGCAIKGNERLGPADCRMSWHQGGALRDSAALAEEIEKHLQQVLAEKRSVLDNGNGTAGAEKVDHGQDFPAEQSAESD